MRGEGGKNGRKEGRKEQREERREGVRKADFLYIIKHKKLSSTLLNDETQVKC